MLCSAWSWYSAAGNWLRTPECELCRGASFRRQQIPPFVQNQNRDARRWIGSPVIRLWMPMGPHLPYVGDQGMRGSWDRGVGPYFHVNRRQTIDGGEI